MALNMKDIGRSGAVNRWHSVRTNREQTLAEHHYLVTMIAMEAAERMYGEKLMPQDKLDLLEYALRHDSPELISGDLASPVKRKIVEICGIDPMEQIEAEICPRYALAKEKVKDTPFQYIAKLADLIDALLFIENEATNDHGRLIAKKYYKFVDDKINQAQSKFPSLNWNHVNNILNEMLYGEDSQITFEKGS